MRGEVCVCGVFCFRFLVMKFVAVCEFVLQAGAMVCEAEKRCLTLTRHVLSFPRLFFPGHVTISLTDIAYGHDSLVHSSSREEMNKTCFTLKKAHCKPLCCTTSDETAAPAAASLPVTPAAGTPGVIWCRLRLASHVPFEMNSHVK